LEEREVKLKADSPPPAGMMAEKLQYPSTLLSLSIA
jgi:hypothetical protein